ncbi:polypeptide N-acetylgalactosaminyltransferase 5 isoform X2 [Erinaceus europaeus]|uniref:Polypeptide N-acetylgalactosaminyltransferase n=1 Tax=Erinaceus europaeus TaxID=9365 RepID=A0ABM3WBN8_ERIEU|nr:polypeptide N-acetylgalactosaminyltransferase 5 isoform X2 [Erinaceus europaeus]
MNKIRKFFRGSGRFLMFIFVASVIWLLFDMAALRLSFRDINKEDILRRGWKGLRAGPDHSIKDMKPPMKRSGKVLWAQENWRKTEGADLDKFQKKNKIHKIPERGKAAHLQDSAPQQIPPMTLIREEKEGRHMGTEPSSHTMTPRHRPALQIQETLSVATRGMPFVKIPASTGSRAIRQEGLKSPGLNRDTSKQALGRDLDEATSFPADKPTRPLVSASREALNDTESQSKMLNAKENEVHRNLPFSQVIGNSVQVKKQSDGTPLEDFPAKEQGTQVGGGQELSFSDSHVVVITKEEEKTSTKEVPATESKALFSLVLDEDQRKQIPRNRNDTHFSLLALQRAAVSQINQTLSGAPEPARAKLTAKFQSVQHSQHKVKIPQPEDPGMHRVLQIDVTVSPRDPKAPGQFGRPVVVPLGKEKEAERRWKEGNFNVYLSDLIPVDRAIEDTRPAGCEEQLVHDSLPTTSVIMCFVDEVWSTLLRSVHSVLNRSPPNLIKEILLVDDFSTKDYLKDKLDKYMAQFPKVRILRLRERHGLIRARLAGAEQATGDVLTFLDSHVECNIGWLEPLLERVYLSKNKVACPVIEVISDKDMSYMTVDNFQRGIFVWPMNFAWRTIPPDVVAKNRIKETDIIRCPVMAGGLFSIDKNYFFELGTYDHGLDVWGGENMELSFKVWMCGGEIEIIPCSRVGHIFRNDNPYSFPRDRMRTVERNLVRVAEVWLDEYKDLFYGHGDHLMDQELQVGDLSQQRELRKKLRCKSFKWYLEHVFPDLKAPAVRATGVLQQFNYTWLRLIKHRESCLAPIPDNGTLELHPCDNRNKGIKWLHKSTSVFHPELVNHIVFENYHQLLCLEGNLSQKILKVVACDPMKSNQKWRFENYYEA